mgnify:CR=1 FL=1
MLIGKQLLEKVDELKKLGHDDQFICSACGYSNEDSFNTAFFYSKNANPKSNTGHYSTSKLDSEIKNAAHERNALRQLSEDRAEINSFLNRTPVTGKHLAIALNKLSGNYRDSEIAIACGYVEKNSLSAEELDSLISKYSAKAIEKIELKPSIELFEEEKNIALKKYKVQKEYGYNTLSIFKNRLCLLDEDHGGTVYIPTRIVKESKDWAYSKVDLKDFSFQNLIDEEMIPSKDPTYSDLEYGQELGLKEEQVKKLNLDLIREAESEVRDHIDSFSFNEPMKYIHVNQYWYLDHKLECLDWFEHEEIAEFHGLRYEDCDEASRWCDG